MQPLYRTNKIYNGYLGGKSALTSHRRCTIETAGKKVEQLGTFPYLSMEKFRTVSISTSDSNCTFNSVST